MPVDLLLRQEKGTVLTHTELDTNMTSLQDGVNASRPESVSVTTATYSPTTHRVMLVDTTAQSISINLPDPSENYDKIYYVKKVDASVNTVTINPFAAETIDGSASVVLTTQWEVVRLISDGVDWFVL